MPNGSKGSSEGYINRQREEVTNPFNERLRMPERTKTTNQALPRSAYQVDTTGASIVNALVGFSGVAADQYTKSMNKKIAADKIIQTSRATQGLAPSDDSTTAGYKAHAIVKINQQADQFQAEMAEASKSDMTDDEWEELIQQGYKSIDENLRSDYSIYEENLELQQFTSVALRERMQALSLQRESNKMQLEINKRVNLLTDSVSTSINSALKASLPGNLKVQQEHYSTILSSIDKTSKALKLTPMQQDEAVLKAVITSNSLEGIELSKKYNGYGRKTSLFSRSNKLQRLEESLLKSQKEEEQYSLIEERRKYEKDFINEGDVKTFLDYAKGNDYLTPGRVNSLWDKRDALIAERKKRERVASAISDPIKSVDPGTTKKEIQAALEEDFQGNLRIEQKNAKVDSIEDPEQKQIALQDAKAKAIRKTANNAVAEGEVIDRFVKDFEMIATTDLASLAKQQDGKSLSLDQTPEVFQDAIKTFNSMSPASQQAHLNSMNSENANIIRGAIDLTDRGIPIVDALRKSQVDARVPKAYKTKEVVEAAEKVIDEIGDGWFTPDVKDKQEQYVLEEIRGELSRSQYPGSDKNIERVAAGYKSRFIESDGIRYAGTAKELTKLTKLNQDKITEAFEDMKLDPVIAAQLESASELYRFDVDEVFAVTNPKTGSFHFRSPDGAYMSEEYKLSSLKSYYDKQKVEASKRQDKIKKAFFDPGDGDPTVSKEDLDKFKEDSKTGKKPLGLMGSLVSAWDYYTGLSLSKESKEKVKESFVDAPMGDPLISKEDKKAFDRGELNTGEAFGWLIDWVKKASPRDDVSGRWGIKEESTEESTEAKKPGISLK